MTSAIPSDQSALPPPAALRRRWSWPGEKPARAIFALMLREMATTYGRSPGGYLWAIADPVAGVILMTVVFGLALRAPPLGTSFALFYASGYLPFMAYSEITMKVGQAIRYSRPLLTYPSVTFVDAIVSRLVLNLLTHMVVGLIVISGIAWISMLPLYVNPIPLANSIGMLTVLGLGLGTFNCYVFGTYPLWERIWGILNRPLFFISGVFYIPDSMPSGFRDIVLWNPLTHVISEFRAGIYPTYDARYVNSMFVYGFGLGFLFLGMLLLYRRHRYLIDEGA